MYIHRIALALTTLATLGTTAAAERYIPVHEQRKAIMDCRYEMGFRGPAHFGAEFPDVPPGGQTHLWIIPDANLSVANADRINACADERLGRSPAKVEVTRTEHVGACPASASVLYGGVGYCVGN